MAVAAAQEAMQQARKAAADIDAVIVAASNMQRPYPAIAIEIQDALGIPWLRFRHECSLLIGHLRHQQTRDAVGTGSARCVLIVNPEICSGHLNFRDRDSTSYSAMCAPP
ncbi:MAG: hypothetical protein R3E50_04285 [Halioglobus sp.]